MIDPDAEEIVARDDPEPSPETVTRPSQGGPETVPDGAEIIEPCPDPAGLTIFFGFQDFMLWRNDAPRRVVAVNAHSRVPLRLEITHVTALDALHERLDSSSLSARVQGLKL